MSTTFPGSWSDLAPPRNAASFFRVRKASACPRPPPRLPPACGLLLCLLVAWPQTGSPRKVSHYVRAKQPQVSLGLHQLICRLDWQRWHGVPLVALGITVRGKASIRILALKVL